MRSSNSGLIAALRILTRDIQSGDGVANSVCYEAATRIEELAQEIAGLKQVMLAAYDEIHEHWGAHCDSEGCGPENLMRCLKEGIPSNHTQPL